MGFPRIYTGYPAFDEALSITGNSASQLVKLLEDETLRYMIASQPDVSFALRKKSFHITAKLMRDSANEVSVLTIETRKIVDELEPLKQLVELQQRMLDRLCEQGVTAAA